ncbi:hypothetical protein STEG23_022009 [Scotinomys teguina]
MDVLFTPVSFILSVPDADIVPNCALKTRGANTTQCQKQEGTLKPCGIIDRKESYENVPNTLIFLCYREECIDRAIFFSVEKSCLKISLIKVMCRAGEMA